MRRLALSVVVVLWGAGQAEGAVEWVVTQLTDNSYNDGDPRVSDPRVAWDGGSDSFDSMEVFLFDGIRTIQLTDNDRYDGKPEVSDFGIVWQTYDGNDYEIMLYDGVTTIQLTDNAVGDVHQDISGTNVVWEIQGGGSSGVYLYDGNTTRQLNDTDHIAFTPKVSGSGVVWMGDDADDTEIFFFDGTVTTQLTDNDYDDIQAQVSGSSVVWESRVGVDYEIMLYDGNTITRLTNNVYRDLKPHVDGSYVVWQGYDGNDDEIFVYDGETTVQLTDNSFDDGFPRISGSTIAWEGFDGNDWEVFMATAVPDPFTLTSLADGDWNTASTWDDGTQVPTAQYDTIVRRHAITVTTDAAAKSLKVVTANAKVIVDAGVTLDLVDGYTATTGSLEMRVSGSSVGKINAGGDVTLSPESELYLRIDGAVPFKAGTYTLLAADSITGKFATSTGLGRYVGDGPDLDGLDYGDKTLTVTIDWDLNQGDANLNGKTDVQDFNIWNAYKFTSETDWRTGDFNGDGITDVRDFNQWNAAKFTAAWDKPATEGQVPEPTALVLLIGGLLGIGGRSLAQRFSLSSPSSEKEQSP